MDKKTRLFREARRGGEERRRDHGHEKRTHEKTQASSPLLLPVCPFSSCKGMLLSLHSMECSVGDWREGDNSL